ncbi:MAG: aminodeoxychorismate synthase component I [Gammaproteobacteria bacterium]|uniref:Aminodeoxychorismate synthase component I n=1 Tax=Candidatus Thiopontia autotrophica TaxID=2841688 RepID=A0A8J6TMN5_9GAMM|nr:aminodeoxychorismate synthase component I [Candidatus Thiopontia autotrophica]
MIDLLALHAVNPERYPYLLESAASGSGAQWDILFAFPEEIIRVEDEGFLAALDRAWARARCRFDNGADSELPFRGGWFLFLDYELAHEIEPVLSRCATSSGNTSPSSQAYATHIPAAILQEHSTGRIHFVDEDGELTERVKLMQEDLSNLKPLHHPAAKIVPATISEESPGKFLDGVERIKHYIVEGDVFQVNLSRKWQGELSESVEPYQIYQRLRESNPAPFAGLALQDDMAVISSSPERLIKVTNGVAETRPIAGTHPRSRELGEDEKLSERLLAHPKEQAEHIMLIDLERNDLGRVCQPGTIKVDELMVLESYAHVHHIVSNIGGELRDGITPGDVIRALFPGGTITGCPKVRCMEIIDELEPEPRGAYTGSFGYLNHNGDMDLNILIRTITQEGNTLSLRAGAGIVHDSIPQRELEETRAKARGMLMALGVEP